jgi:ketosteroid isomerase-like protein
MNRNLLSVIACLLAFVLVPSFANATDEPGLEHRRLEESLRATETAFAKTMADRDHEAFAQFISPEAVFFGGTSVHRGREAIAAAWALYFDGEAAPFSWEPQSVAVLESGTLGVTSGPVFNPLGERIGTFNSVWRLDEDGGWHIVFDRGCPPCDCP